MQAITTLHAQLSAATEKLDVAQKSLTNQKKEIYDLKEEGRLMRAEIDDLRVMLDDIENDEKSDLRRLEDLRLQAMPLDLDFQRISGALDVVPHSFQALGESFVTESREIMGKVEDFLSLAVKENFWKNKIMMNLHHIQAVKVRLRKQTLLINEAMSLEEKSLNDQLADEESSLAIVQGCIDAIERKNAALISERGMDKSYFPPYQTFKRSTGGTYRPPETSKNNETSNFADEISGAHECFH